MTIKKDLINKIIVDQSYCRLDIFLSNKLKINRSQIQKMIKNKQIMVNDKLPKKAGDRVKENYQITIKPINNQVDKQKTVKPIKNSKQQTVNSKIKIIKETPNYIIINKPDKLLTHPRTTKSDDVQSVSEIMAKKYSEIIKVGDKPNLRSGIVHRLDKDASGLMVVARTQNMFDNLKKQFQNRTVTKEYLVLVHGQVKTDEGKIDFPIARSRNTERMSALPTIKLNLADYYKKIKGNHRYNKSREALTEFWIEKKYLNFTLLRVKIHTGRTHQIRVHMLAYNHPVVGDNIYFQKKQKRKYDENCGRLFLHCVKLGFKDLDNKEQLFEIKLPTKLNDFLKKIK